MPSPLLPLIGILAVTLLLVAIGSLAAGRNASTGVRLIGGWSVVITTYVAGSAVLGLSLGLVAGCLGVVGAVGLLSTRRNGWWPNGPRGLLALLLCLPLLAVLAGNPGNQWDEISFWLPNALFLVEMDRFPVGMEMYYLSSSSAYPYGINIIIHLMSLIVGGFIDNGGALFNAVLIIAFALLIVRAWTEGDDEEGAKRVRPLLLGLALLLAFYLNPSFQRKFVFTAYGDSATGVLLAFLGYAGWRFLNRLAEEKLADAKRLAWHFGLIGIAFLQVKQTNLVLFILLLIGMGMVMLCDRRVPFSGFLRLLPRMLAPPLLVYFAWRYHVASHEVFGEFPLRFSGFDPTRLYDALRNMWWVIYKKWMFFGLSTLILAWGVRSLFSTRTEWDRLTLILSTLFVGQNLFLLLNFLTFFGDLEGRRAASYWRYTTQIGPVIWLGALIWIGRRIQARPPTFPSWSKRLGWLPVIVVIALPIVQVKKHRYGMTPPLLHLRAVATKLGPMLKDGKQVLLYDGFYSLFLRYLLNPYYYHPDGAPPQFRVEISKMPAAHILGRSMKADYIFVSKPYAAQEEAFGLSLPAGASYLVERRGERFSIARTWKYPDFDDPDRVLN